MEGQNNLPKKNVNPFAGFDDINDGFTERDKEALKKLKKNTNEDIKASELRFIKGNHSILGEIKDTSNFYQMEHQVGDNVIKNSKKQHFVSLLASSLVPIAPIGVKDGRYYSKLVEDHESFSESSEKNVALFALTQYVLFRDTDKPGYDRPNILGGVSFDFEYARFDTLDLPTYVNRLPSLIDNLKSINMEEIKEMLRSVQEFKILISGETGEKYLQKIEDVTGYKTISPKQIQEVLLRRVDELESILITYIK